MLAGTRPVRCAVGKRPDYFVPGDEPTLLIGCARLGVSGKPADFSLNLGRIDGKDHLCINLAYFGRGRPGFYIPAICKLAPPPTRFWVRAATQPRQGVRGYELVVWGYAPHATPAVEAHFGYSTTAAAVFPVRTEWAQRYGRRPFSLFIVELPLRAACAQITIRATRSKAIRRVGRHPRLCKRR